MNKELGTRKVVACRPEAKPHQRLEKRWFAEVPVTPRSLLPVKTPNKSLTKRGLCGGDQQKGLISQRLSREIPFFHTAVVVAKTTDRNFSVSRVAPQGPHTHGTKSQLCRPIISRSIHLLPLFLTMIARYKSVTREKTGILRAFRFLQTHPRQDPLQFLFFTICARRDTG